MHSGFCRRELREAAANKELVHIAAVPTPSQQSSSWFPHLQQTMDTPENIDPSTSSLKRENIQSQGRTRQKQTFGGHLHSYIEQPISISAFPTKASSIPMVPLTWEISLCPAFPEVPNCTLQTSRYLIYTQLQKFSDPSFLTI